MVSNEIIHLDPDISILLRDEHSEYDFEALKDLFTVIKGLLQYKPKKRLSPKEGELYSVNWQPKESFMMSG